MAFVVEDGTGKADANSYASATEADAYFGDRNVGAWVGTASVKEAALIRATDYIETRFGPRFIGCALLTTQALAFPRGNGVGLPVAVKRAAMEYALRALTSALAPDPKFEANGAVLKSERVKVGPVDTQKEYDVTSAPKFRPYPAADALLRPYLPRAGVVRA